MYVYIQWIETWKQHYAKIRKIPVFEHTIFYCWIVSSVKRLQNYLVKLSTLNVANIKNKIQISNFKLNGLFKLFLQVKWICVVHDTPLRCSILFTVWKCKHAWHKRMNSHPPTLLFLLSSDDIYFKICDLSKKQLYFNI